MINIKIQNLIFQILKTYYYYQHFTLCTKGIKSMVMDLEDMKAMVILEINTNLSTFIIRKNGSSIKNTRSKITTI